MKYPISNNIDEKSQHLIPWLDYYYICKHYIRQLLSMDSPGSQLSNDILWSKICGMSEISADRCVNV